MIVDDGVLESFPRTDHVGGFPTRCSLAATVSLEDVHVPRSTSRTIVDTASYVHIP